MDFGDVIGLAIAMGSLLGIIGIFTGTYRRRLEHKERIAELRSGAPVAPVEDRSAEVAKLESRIRVLERIATDKTTTLAAQIEDLREPAN